MVVYNGNVYVSNAEVVRCMYHNGTLVNTPESKKALAQALGIAVQSVHATIVKLDNKKVPPVKSVPAKPVVAKFNLYSDVENQLLTRFNECYKEVEAAIGLKLEKIPVRFDLKGTAGGYFCVKYGVMFFRINLELAKANLEEYLNQVVPHEFCHYIVRLRHPQRPRPHGHEWKFYMRTIFNLTPDRCHKMDVSACSRRQARDYKYSCGCQTFNLTKLRHQKIMNGRRYFCKRCGMGLKYEGQ